MNFQSYFLQGKQGKNIGLNAGISTLNRAMRGIQKKRIYTVAAGPKVGKSKLVNFVFILSPFLEAIRTNTLHLIHWIFYSFEMDRITTEFNFAAFFFAHDFDVHTFSHNDEIFGMCSDYLMHKMLDKNGNVVPVCQDHEEKLIWIYQNRIAPLFGRFDPVTGKQTEKGKIDFIEESDNPTGLRNYLLKYAKENGEFRMEKYNTLDDKGRKVTKERIAGYKENNPDLKTIIVTDTMRKLKRERNFSLKENVDKWVEYQKELRNWCEFTFVDIIHTNRNMASVERMKFAGEFIYPTGDDIKDSGNLSEESNMVITMFNPNDEKYALEKHFHLELENYPNYRSIHIVESRETECPIHLQVNMFGGVNMFQPIEEGYTQ